MLYEQTLALKVGDVVMWKGDPKDTGKVTAVQAWGVNIDWDNGVRGWLHREDMQHVSLATPEVK